MFRKILVPIDGSALSEAILPAVKELLAASTAEAALLIVHEPPKPTRRHRKGLRRPLAVAGSFVLSATPPEYAETKDQAVEREKHELLEYLDQIARTIAPAGRPVESAVRMGEPAKEIIDFARRGQFDLIVMATHGRSGLPRTLHESVTAAVIRSRVAPVLVIPAKPVPPAQASAD